MALLSIATALVAALGAWHAVLGLAVGLLATCGFAAIAFIRLAKMVVLGGALGKLAATSRNFLFKLGVMHE